MPVLAVVQPLPAVRQTQVQPQRIKRRIGFPQVSLPGRAALALSGEERLLEIQRGIHQTLYHCLAVHFRELLGLGQQPGQQIKRSG